ncbi:MAG: hypothetical protein JST83_17265, partial [Bacteroidetes bacterium]|nr:hypothetical protein [Bacteroidota bacterium]
CFLWEKVNGVEVWVKPLSGDRFAVCFLNRSSSEKSLNFDPYQSFTDPDFGTSYTITKQFNAYNIWDNNYSTMGENIKAKIAPHDVLFVTFQKSRP